MKKLIPVVCALALCTSFVVCSVSNNSVAGVPDDIGVTGMFVQNDFEPVVEMSVSQVNTSETMTPQDFINYLNEAYTSIDTPMGTIQFTHICLQNNYEMYPYDYWIMTDWSGVGVFDIEHSIRYTEEEKEETKEALRQVQKNIAADAEQYLPGMKIQGGYYTCFYRYPYLQLGFVSIRFLTWRNFSGSYDYNQSYLDGFGWDATIDDYDFTDPNDPVHEFDYMF